MVVDAGRSDFDLGGQVLVAERVEATLTDQADELETMTIATYIALGITAAFGISTIVLLAVGAGDGTPSSIEVGAVPTAQGGAATMRGRF